MLGVPTEVLLLGLAAVLGLGWLSAWRKGDPKFESLRDDAKTFARKLGKYGLDEIALPFEDITQFNEQRILDRLRDLFTRFADEDWFLESVAARLIERVIGRILENELLRSRLVLALRGTGWQLVRVTKPDDPPGGQAPVAVVDGSQGVPAAGVEELRQLVIEQRSQLDELRSAAKSRGGRKAA